MKSMNTHRMVHHEIHDDTSFKAKLINSLREIVFGLQDGIVSTLGAITGIAAGTFNTQVVLLSGFVIIVVESLSMAAGTFLSSKSEKEGQDRLLKEEAWEIEQFPEAETEEVREFYRLRGFSEEEVEMITKRITSDKKLWLEEMALRELRIFPEEKSTPKKDAIFMGVSYIIGGLVSLSSYFFLPISFALPLSIGFSIVILFGIGFVKGKLVETKKFRSGLEMVIVSAVATGLGYAVGRIVSGIFDISV
jgi:vacuolar iron transporter family protein